MMKARFALAALLLSALVAVATLRDADDKAHGRNGVPHPGSVLRGAVNSENASSVARSNRPTRAQAPGVGANISSG